jgi:hypothetical protein
MAETSVQTNFRSVNWNYRLTMGVSHCGLAIYIKKNLKAKEE